VRCSCFVLLIFVFVFFRKKMSDCERCFPANKRGPSIAWHSLIYSRQLINDTAVYLFVCCFLPICRFYWLSCPGLNSCRCRPSDSSSSSHRSLYIGACRSLWRLFRVFVVALFLFISKSIDNSNSQRRSSRRQGQSRNRFRNDTTTKEQSSSVVMTRRLIHRERGERESPGPARDTFKKSAGGNKVAGRSRLTAVKKHTAPLNTHMCAQHVELDRYTSRAWNNWNTNKRNIDKV
jgi:hypothetical protein